MINSIPFNKPYFSKNTIKFIAQTYSKAHTAGDGSFTKQCSVILKSLTQSKHVLLTHSCTAALEMAAILIDIKPGDEVIMPSYTFVSTANAFVLRGAIPVFVDIREDTLNINETLIENAITQKTRAIVPVHYAGVSCDMDKIMSLAELYNLFVIEDAAQGIFSSYKGRMLGSIGSLAAYSFHETKNIISGEGGALLINDARFTKRAEIIREKGTDRSQFFRGEIDKYTWQDMGSSYLPSDIIAAVLFSQLQEAEELIAKRLKAWHYYHELFAPLEAEGLVKRPYIPKECQHNGHIYYILINMSFNLKKVLYELKSNHINAVPHYVPLHSSPAGQKFCRTHGELTVTDAISERLIRLPLWIGISREQQNQVMRTVKEVLMKMKANTEGNILNENILEKISTKLEKDINFKRNE